jgi:hypothetical protein
MKLQSNETVLPAYALTFDYGNKYMLVTANSPSCMAKHAPLTWRSAPSNFLAKVFLNCRSHAQ